MGKRIDDLLLKLSVAGGCFLKCLSGYLYTPPPQGRIKVVHDKRRYPWEVWQRIARMAWGNGWRDFCALSTVSRDIWGALLGPQAANSCLWTWILEDDLKVSPKPHMSSRRLCVLLAILHMLLRNAVEYCDSLALVDIETVLRAITDDDVETLLIIRTLVPEAKLQAVCWLVDVATKQIVCTDSLYSEVPCKGMLNLENARKWLHLYVDRNVIPRAEITECCGFPYGIPKFFRYPSATLTLQQSSCVAALRILAVLEGTQGTRDFGMDVTRDVMWSIYDGPYGSPGWPLAALVLLHKALRICFYPCSDDENFFFPPPFCAAPRENTSPRWCRFHSDQARIMPGIHRAGANNTFPHNRTGNYEILLTTPNSTLSSTLLLRSQSAAGSSSPQQRSVFREPGFTCTWQGRGQPTVIETIAFPHLRRSDKWIHSGYSSRSPQGMFDFNTYRNYGSLHFRTTRGNNNNTSYRYVQGEEEFNLRAVSPWGRSSSPMFFVDAVKKNRITTRSSSHRGSSGKEEGIGEYHAYEGLWCAHGRVFDCFAWLVPREQAMRMWAYDGPLDEDDEVDKVLQPPRCTFSPRRAGRGTHVRSASSSSSHTSTSSASTRLSEPGERGEGEHDDASPSSGVVFSVMARGKREHERTNEAHEHMSSGEEVNETNGQRGSPENDDVTLLRRRRSKKDGIRRRKRKGRIKEEGGKPDVLIGVFLEPGGSAGVFFLKV